MWSERDGFYYDVLTYPNGKFAKFRVRSLVGIDPSLRDRSAGRRRTQSIFASSKLILYNNWFIDNRKDLVEQCIIPLEKKGKKVFLLR